MFRKTVRDRFELIRPHLAGDVLDVGCVDARPLREGSTRRIERKGSPTAMNRGWGPKPGLLFLQVAQVNPRVTGLDIDAEGVAALRELGHDVVCGDAETADLGRTFDTIVAGEIIEHLANPGLFLANMRRHLRPGGVLILSTPNPFSGVQAWRIWKAGRPKVHEQHVAWYDPQTLGVLLGRSGFEVVDGAWVQRRRRASGWKAIFRRYFSSSFVVVTQAQ